MENILLKNKFITKEEYSRGFDFDTPLGDEILFNFSSTEESEILFMKLRSCPDGLYYHGLYKPVGTGEFRQQQESQQNGSRKHGFRKHKFKRPITGYSLSEQLQHTHLVQPAYLEEYFYGEYDQLPKTAQLEPSQSEPEESEPNPKPNHPVYVNCPECFEHIRIHLYGHHVMRVHLTTQLQKQIFEGEFCCSHCLRNFKSQNKLLAHYQFLRNFFLEFTCLICMIQFKNDQKRLEHMVKLHFRYEKPYICRAVNCKYSCSLPTLMERHQATLHKQLFCQFCQKPFFTKQNILKMGKQNGIHECESPHECEHEEDADELYAMVKSHLLLHIRVKSRYKCAKCTLSFVNNHDRKIHFLIGHHSESHKVESEQNKSKWVNLSLVLSENQKAHVMAYRSLTELRKLLSGCEYVRGFPEKIFIPKHITELNTEQFAVSAELLEDNDANQQILCEVDQHKGDPTGLRFRLICFDCDQMVASRNEDNSLIRDIHTHYYESKDGEVCKSCGFSTYCKYIFAEHEYMHKYVDQLKKYDDIAIRNEKFRAEKWTNSLSICGTCGQRFDELLGEDNLAKHLSKEILHVGYYNNENIGEPDPDDPENRKVEDEEGKQEDSPAASSLVTGEASISQPGTSGMPKSGQRKSERLKPGPKTCEASISIPETSGISNSVPKTGGKSKSDPKTCETSISIPGTSEISNSVPETGGKTKSGPKTSEASIFIPGTSGISNSVPRTNLMSNSGPETSGASIFVLGNSGTPKSVSSSFIESFSNSNKSIIKAYKSSPRPFVSTGSNIRPQASGSGPSGTPNPSPGTSRPSGSGSGPSGTLNPSPGTSRPSGSGSGPSGTPNPRPGTSRPSGSGSGLSGTPNPRPGTSRPSGSGSGPSGTPNPRPGTSRPSGPGSGPSGIPNPRPGTSRSSGSGPGPSGTPNPRPGTSRPSGSGSGPSGTPNPSPGTSRPTIVTYQPAIECIDISD